MKENMTFAWIASWFALVGQLLFFLIVSLLTGNWMYAMWSFVVSMAAGVPSMIRTWQRSKVIKAGKENASDPIS
ncbi:UNVERIFIED_CONTAM: hypothetical protein N8J90_11970 [Halobacillus marinus]|uniref:hypothetical protein n=1 Tax=Bacillaceae TaxID=186817 RepID=UPI0002A4E50C|nr:MULTISPECIES: hypothetical protein [Bacillaceae]ELK46536.1 hypothetical protein D479_10396 [Halobacillus sp. BAB-2008]QHT46112.1 hypothetical protein M662_06275 [Bacillus sp. SB49]